MVVDLYRISPGSVQCRWCTVYLLYLQSAPEVCRFNSVLWKTLRPCWKEWYWKDNVAQDDCQASICIYTVYNIYSGNSILRPPCVGFIWQKVEYIPKASCTFWISWVTPFVTTKTLIGIHTWGVQWHHQIWPWLTLKGQSRGQLHYDW